MAKGENIKQVSLKKKNRIAIQEEKTSQRLKCDWSGGMRGVVVQQELRGGTVERIKRWGNPVCKVGWVSVRKGCLNLQGGKNISWLLGQRATKQNKLNVHLNQLLLFSTTTLLSNFQCRP